LQNTTVLKNARIRPSFSTLFAIAGLLLVAGVYGDPTAVQAQQSCTVLDSCTGVTSLPGTSDCEDDACACAQQIECYTRNQSASTDWPVLPGEDMAINRNFFHDRFIETRISPAAYTSWVKYTDPAKGPVDLPNGTVVYKLGYLSKVNDPSVQQKNPSSAFVFIKLKDYCPDDYVVAGSCLGGDWFAMEVALKTYGILTEGTIPDYGKEAKCFGCHAAAQKGDWLWQLYSRRRYP